MSNHVIALLLAGLITLILKGLFIEILAHKKLPPLLYLALNHVPTAVLAALAFPMFFQPSFAINDSTGATLIALLVALLAWRSGNLLLSVGLPFMLILLLNT